MKLKQTLVAVAVALAPMAAMAGGSLDVFYVNQDIDPDGAPSDDGDGFGFRGQAMLGHGVSLTGLYQNADLDNANVNLVETRIGLSYDSQLQGINVGAGAETVSADLNASGPGASLRGYSINGHASLKVIDNLSAYARIGYTDLDEADGMEYEAGLRYALDKNFSAFVEYRYADLNDNGLFGVDFKLSTLRVGGGYTF